MTARRRKALFGMGLGLVLLLVQGLMVSSGMAQSQSLPNVFFSQGQAIFDPQEPMKSQREALQDFQLQAITQAASALLSPAQLGKQYQLIQEKILKQPQRYVQTYQIFSETSGTGGLYRLTGQVTISMDLLKKDLVALPPPSLEGQPPQPAGPTSRSEERRSDGVGEKVRKEAEPTGKTATSGLAIFWAVAEKWEQGWYVPADPRDPEGPFAASVSQESENYGWSLHFPDAGALTPDNDGEVPANQALAQASALGLRQVVAGSVALGETDDGKARIEATLRLLDTASGKQQGEIHRQLVMAEATSHEAAIELAAFVIPQLDRQLRPSAEPSASNQGVARPENEGGARPAEQGELLVLIKSTDGYGDWVAVERILREHFQSLQVRGLEIGPNESLVRLSGVDGAGLQKLHGTRLANGAQLQIARVETEGNAFSLTLMKPSPSQAEPKP